MDKEAIEKINESIDDIYGMLEEMDSRISSNWRKIDDLDTRVQNIEHRAGRRM